MIFYSRYTNFGEMSQKWKRSNKDLKERQQNKKISSKDDDNRVVGGETTGVNEYPWMALIVKRGEVARYMLKSWLIITWYRRCNCMYTFFQCPALSSRYVEDPWSPQSGSSRLPIVWSVMIISWWRWTMSIWSICDLDFAHHHHYHYYSCPSTLWSVMMVEDDNPWRLTRWLSPIPLFLKLCNWRGHMSRPLIINIMVMKIMIKEVSPLAKWNVYNCTYVSWFVNRSDQKLS